MNLGGARRGRVLALIAALLGANALAQSKPEADTNYFVTSVVVGPGGFVRKLPWAPGERSFSAGLHALIAYRVLSVFDVGIHLSNQWLRVDGLSPGASAFAWTTAGGVAMRFHPLRMLDIVRVDPSVGVGVDFFAYGRQTTTWPAADGREPTVQDDAVPGASLPVSVGLDIAVTKGFALGLLGIWGPWWHTEACSSSGLGASTCEARTTLPEHYFFVGLGCRLNLRFVE